MVSLLAFLRPLDFRRACGVGMPVYSSFANAWFFAVSTSCRCSLFAVSLMPHPFLLPARPFPLVLLLNCSSCFAIAER